MPGRIDWFMIKFIQFLKVVGNSWNHTSQNDPYARDALDITFTIEGTFCHGQIQRKADILRLSAGAERPRENIFGF